MALLLVLVQLAWRAWLLRDAYFFGDDLTLTGKAADTGLTLEYLLHPHAVHVMPVSLAVVWIVTALDPYNWTLAAASLVLMQAGASLAVWRMLTVVFGRRPGLLVPYAVYLFTPLTVPAFHWWAAGIQTLPFQAAIAMSVASHVTYLRRRRARDAVATCAWFLLGLGSFHVKAALAIPLVLFGITLLYFARGRPLRALRRDARALAAYALLPVLYSLLLIVQFGEVTQEARAPSGSSSPRSRPGCSA
ncbi:hypothetical protein [Thermocatellispora tengchongensis]|uniref:hypothetical protein n=1 Tax=Thermocatellispora tengchongensis TaxID=1073253 RepID=UPI00363BE9BF